MQQSRESVGAYGADGGSIPHPKRSSVRRKHGETLLKSGGGYKDDVASMASQGEAVSRRASHQHPTDLFCCSARALHGSQVSGPGGLRPFETVARRRRWERGLKAALHQATQPCALFAHSDLLSAKSQAELHIHSSTANAAARCQLV